MDVAGIIGTKEATDSGGVHKGFGPRLVGCLAEKFGADFVVTVRVGFGLIPPGAGACTRTVQTTGACNSSVLGGWEAVHIWIDIVPYPLARSLVVPLSLCRRLCGKHTH